MGEQTVSPEAALSGPRRAPQWLWLKELIIFIFMVICLPTLLASPSIFIKVVTAFKGQIIYITSSPIFFLPACLISVSLFWLRCCYTAVYGVTEIIAGAVAIYSSINSKLGGAATNIKMGEVAANIEMIDLVARGLSLLGGIYIIIRGLDNIDKELQNHLKDLKERAVALDRVGRLGIMWNQIFRNKRLLLRALQQISLG